MDQTKYSNDESVEEEIIEDISRLDDLDDSFDDSDEIPIFLNDSKDQYQEKRDITANDDVLFDEEVDKILALDDIAKHFQADETVDSDSLVPLKVGAINKERSPLTEDTIFINDKKVSISSLKKINDPSTQHEPSVQSPKKEGVGVSTQQQSSATKKMDKVSSDFLNDILDDITEESETESREKEPEPLQQDKIEKGSLVRNILRCNLFDDQSEVQDTVIVKPDESSDLQLDSQEIYKEREALNSIATTSTEYRTMNDFLNSKIFENDAEYYDRATYLRSLQAQLLESTQERAKLSQENEALKAKLVAEDAQKSSHFDKIESFSKRMESFKRDLSFEEKSLDSIWPKVESFIESEMNLLKSFHISEIASLQEEIIQERRETQMEMDKLRQLLISVKSGSSSIDELRRELEVKHAHEMKELREYFEKRCIDLGKEYTEEVLSLNESMHSKKMTMSSHEVENQSHRAILTEDYAVSYLTIIVVLKINKFNKTWTEPRLN